MKIQKFRVVQESISFLSSLGFEYEHLQKSKRHWLYWHNLEDGKRVEDPNWDFKIDFSSVKDLTRFAEWVRRKTSFRK